MSRVRPILFSTDMIRAILDGRKTVTRRVVKGGNVRDDQEINKNIAGKFEVYNTTKRCGIPQGVILKPPCRPGDTLYVRETWTFHENAEGGIIFKARCPEKLAKVKKWRPSIHMPKKSARIWLKVTDVRVERLQDITNEQILKEGANPEAIEHYIKQMPEESEEWVHAAHVIEFKHLWDSG